MESTSHISRRVLLIGPLPPPFGGARVSFRLFLDEIAKLDRPKCIVVNAPLRKETSDKTGDSVDHIRTLSVVVRSLVKIRNVDSVWIFCSSGFGMSYALLYICVCKFMRTPVSIRFFGGHPYLRALRIWQPFRHLVESILRWASSIVVETDIGKQEFPANFQKLLRVVYGYRRATNSHVVEAIGYKHSTSIKFYYAGLISREKGTYLLVDAFNLANTVLKKFGASAELHIFGVDAEGVTEYMEGIPDIFYRGSVSNDELLELLSDFDVLTFPSLYRNEGHSGTIMEAMLAGKPVICFDLPGPSEIVTDHVNGIVVQSGSKSQFADAIVRLTHDPELRQRLSLRARSDSKQFDARFAAPKLLDALSR